MPSIFQFQDCDINSLPAGVLSDLSSVDYLGFDHGSLNSVYSNVTDGLTVEKLINDTHTFPQHLGHFELRYTQLKTGTISPALLYNFKNLSSVAIIVSTVKNLLFGGNY